MNMKLNKLSAAIIFGATLLTGAHAMANIHTAQSATAIEIPAQAIQLTQEWDKVFPQSDKVTHRKVTFKNRYGITLAADLYVPKNARGKRPAIAVGGPFGAVKEQSSGLYAQTLAERGFVTLAFDASYTGESSGLPRNMASPDINTEDFSAAVDFLGSLDNVNRDEIGILGICGFGGFALNAAISDPRIKAVATCSMYDMSAAVRDALDPAALEAAKERLSRQRWTDAEDGSPEYNPTFAEAPLDAVPEGLDPITEEWMRFYAVRRGHHPRARGGFTTTSDLALLNVRLLAFLDEISPRPILFVVGDRAHSKFFSENAYARAKEPKELFVVEDAEHIDLYDRTDRIPFDKLADFFHTI